MTPKERLHRLVEALPETEVAAAARYLEFLATTTDPAALTLALADADDEPVTEEDLAAHREAQEDIAAGRVYTLAQVREELGVDDLSGDHR